MRKAYRVVLGMVGALVLALALGLSLWVGGRGGGQQEKKSDRAEDGKADDQSCEASCARRRDKMGRALVAVHTDMVPWGCHCASVEELEKLKQMPVWVVRGKRVWADDWTPCPYEIDAERCDAIGIHPERGTEVCLQYAENEWLEYDVDIIDDPATGDFIAIGVGEGPAIFGLHGVGGWMLHEPLPRRVSLDREGAFVEDVSAQDFLIIECLPSGDILFDLVDSDGKPLQKSWYVSVEYPLSSWLSKKFLPLAIREPRHGLLAALADRELEVRFNIEGMPPQYRTVRAVKGQTTKVVVQIDTSDTTGIEGYVWDADTLRPIREASVSVTQHAAFLKGGVKIFDATTDENGYYSFQGVEPGVLEEVSAWAWDFGKLESVVYLGKKLEKGERLRLDFPMKRTGDVVSLDPGVDIVRSLPEFGSCEPPDWYDVYRKKIQDTLNQAFDRLVNTCPGPGSSYAAKVSQWYSDPKHSTQQVCIQCFQDNTLAEKWPYVVGENGKAEPGFALILSCELVTRGTDQKLASTLFHELMHLGDPKDMDKTQSEINAYACEYTCMGGESYPGGVPSEDLKKCIPPEVAGGGGGGGGGWDWMFNNDKFFDSCPTPSSPTRCAEVRPRSDGSPHCEICCPAGGPPREGNCNPKRASSSKKEDVQLTWGFRGRVWQCSAL